MTSSGNSNKRQGSQQNQQSGSTGSSNQSRNRAGSGGNTSGSTKRKRTIPQIARSLFTLDETSPGFANPDDMAKLHKYARSSEAARTSALWMLKQLNPGTEASAFTEDQVTRMMNLLENVNRQLPDDTDSSGPGGHWAGTTFASPPPDNKFPPLGPLADEMYIFASPAERAFLAKYPVWYDWVRSHNEPGTEDDATIDAVVEAAIACEMAGDPVPAPPGSAAWQVMQHQLGQATVDVIETTTEGISPGQGSTSSPGASGATSGGQTSNPWADFMNFLGPLLQGMMQMAPMIMSAFGG